MAVLHRTARCPSEVLDWIAWYGEPELPPEVRSTIDRHAAECLACRREMVLLHTGEDVTDDVPDGEAVLERVLARVRAEVPAPPTRRGPRALLRPALAAAAGLTLLVGGAWLVGVGTGPEPLRTAAGAAAAAHSGRTLDVVFRDDASWAQVRGILGELDASLAEGSAPATAGRVRLQLAKAGDPALALQALRASGLTLFAEPALR